MIYSQCFGFLITVKVAKIAKSGHQKSASLKQTQCFPPRFYSIKNCVFSCTSLISTACVMQYVCMDPWTSTFSKKKNERKLYDSSCNNMNRQKLIFSKNII